MQPLLAKGFFLLDFLHKVQNILCFSSSSRSQGKSLSHACLNVRLVAFAADFAHFNFAFAMLLSSTICHMTAVLGRCITSCMLPHLGTMT